MWAVIISLIIIIFGIAFMWIHLKWLLVLSLIVIVFVIVILIGNKVTKKRKNQTLFQNLWVNKGYNTTKNIDSLYIDEEKKSWYVYGCNRVFKFSDVVDCNIYVNFIRSNVVNKITVSINVRDTNYPLIKILVLNAETKTDSFTYKNLYALALKIQNQFKNMYNVKTISEKVKSMISFEPSIGRSNNSGNYYNSKKEKPQYSKVEAAPNDYVVFDLETTGLDCHSDSILEIGAIKYVNGVEADKFHTYVNPHRSIPRSASEINHITAAKVRNAPDIKPALSDFVSFVGDLPLIAFNSDFDMGFIQIKCIDCFDTAVKNDVIDALPLARKYLPDLPNKKLETIKKHFNLDVGSHNAIDDCVVTNHLYQYCRQFEELKYRYVIPFGYRERELSELEIEYLNTVVEICEKNDVPKKDLKMYSASNKLLTIERKGEKVVGLKLFGKLQYVLLEIPFTKFQSEYKTELLFTEGNQSERDCTRVFTENPSDLWNFEKCIVKKKQRNWSTS